MTPLLKFLANPDWPRNVHMRFFDFRRLSRIVAQVLMHRPAFVYHELPRAIRQLPNTSTGLEQDELGSKSADFFLGRHLFMIWQ